MSEFSENQNENLETSASQQEPEAQETYKDEYAEFGTIFSDPSANKEPEKKGKKNVSDTKKSVRTIIAATLVLALVVGTIFAAIKWIPTLPDDEGDNVSTLFSDTVLYEHDLSKIDSVTVTNPNGVYTFLSEPIESSDSSSDTASARWYVQGIDKDMVDSSSIEEMLSPIATLTVKRSVDTKTPEQCGFSQPKYKADVTSAEYGDFTLYIGADSPDNTGTYIMTSKEDKIYIAYNTAISNLDFEIIKFANTDAFEPAKFNKSVVSYCDDEGVLETFDTIRITGKRFEKPVVITPNKDESLTAYIGYMLTSPMNRNANTDNVDAVFSIFSNGLAVEGAYSYDVTAKSLAEVGLNDPDMIIELTISGETKTFKVAEVDDSYCAVINDESKFIKKVSKTTAVFTKNGPTDFYSSFVYLRAIGDISKIDISYGDKSYEFDITIDREQEENEKKYSVTCNGKKITYSYYQDLYQELVGLTGSDFSTDPISAEPDMTIKYTNSNNGKVTTVCFYKCSATKYQYSVDGVPMGKIVSSAYNKIVKYAANVAADKGING